MINSLKALLTHFFVFTGASNDVDESRGLQLATAVLLVEVMRSDARFNPQERAATVAALRTQFTLTDHELNRLMAHAKQAATLRD